MQAEDKKQTQEQQEQQENQQNVEEESQAQQQPHAKYKTTLCRHWQQTNTCSRGESCHFAHGDTEIRQESENQPAQNISPHSFQFLQNHWNSGQPHNYKSVLCKNFDQGKCNYGENCSFAHGKNELRKPDSQQQNTKQMRAIQEQLQYSIYQYNMMNANQQLKMAQQFQYYISQLKQFPGVKTLITASQQAEKAWISANLVECQQILNNAILDHSHNLKKDDQIKFDKIKQNFIEQKSKNEQEGINLPMMPNFNMAQMMNMGLGMMGMNMNQMMGMAMGGAPQGQFYQGKQ